MTANYRQIIGPTGLLATLTPFEGNSMRAAAVDGGEYISYGRMDREYVIAPDAVYVVWSCSTPIAWVDSKGRVTVPDQTYSRTTSRQQGACRAWLNYASAPTGEMVATGRIHPSNV